MSAAPPAKPDYTLQGKEDRSYRGRSIIIVAVSLPGRSEGCNVAPASLERLDQCLELRSKGLGVGRDRWDLAVNAKQLIDGHLRRPH